MDTFSEMFQRDLIILDGNYGDREELFDKVVTFLQEKGYVKETFKEAIKTREGNYPTGLRTAPFHVAIPHTDPEHINKPFIVFIRPLQQIQFMEMGTDDQYVQAELVFMLGLQRSEKQTALLQKLIDMFMQEEAMNFLMNENDPVNILAFLKKNIK
ncbi:PTS sugar transporter subunit IIA [Numidum massiliense]|uniref:PTS sugar transporter subunit IIA n=1 Tax=Numidum massiliense TaxID=1522315 RepID=UPI0006D52BA9|nr:PTS sugar transporter subunit IIA [Numidum massiliense]